MLMRLYRKDCRHTPHHYIKKNLIILFILAMINTSFAQVNIKNTTDSIFNSYVSINQNNQSPFYVVKQHSNTQLQNCNYKITRRISALVTIVKITEKEELKNKNECVANIAPANNNWKLSPSLAEQLIKPLSKNNRIVFTITAADINLFLNDNSTENYKLLHLYKEQNTAVLNCTSGYFLMHVLPDSNVFFADIYFTPQSEIQVIGYNRSLNTINYTHTSIPGATGNNITIGIKEKKMDELDIDLLKRVKKSAIANAQTDNHATVIATLAGGAGNSFYSGKGLAWQCNFFPSSFDALFPDDGNVLAQNNVSVQNHSYGTVIQNFYGAEAAAYDVQTMQQKNLVHIFSSGNKGQNATTQGPYANLPGFGNITGNFKMAKNIITVAATDTGGNITPFSSAGPLYDGRMAPQLAALGPNGTSDAAAIVSGGVALLQQVYKDSNNNILPTAALIKAVLFNSADDVGNRGIDHRSGFGALNIFNALRTIQQSRYIEGTIAQNETWIKNISVPAQAANLKLTLSYTDTAATVNNNQALINDIDIEVRESATGKTFLPWCLSTFAAVDSLNNLPKRKRDSLNTAEQVSIDLPVAGEYQIKITGKKIQTINKQNFAIAYNWDTVGSFTFINPVNASDIDRNEDTILKIKWKAVSADTTTTGNFFISYNNGLNWQPIGTNIKLMNQRFAWPLPDTATAARLKMECNFGTFFSPAFIIAPVTKINVDFICTDSLQLSWNKHVYAGSYKVYALADSAYLKTIFTTTDTSITLQRKNNATNIYAVLPILTNNLTAVRSAAVDVSKQGVNCFYKNLLAENKNDKVLLSLQLSTTEKITGIVIEKLNSDTGTTTTLQQLKANPGQFNYTAMDNSPGAGANYYRAKIFFINGSFVYTETVQIISNGTHFIFLYPNPVRQTQLLNYQVKDGYSNVQLQIMDTQGRLINRQPIGLNGQIKTIGLIPGLFIYRLLNGDGAILETGKFIVVH